MARRALPKIDPAVDFSRQLCSFEDLQPWDVARLFGRAGPLEIEVGVGKGMFLQQTAPEHPELNYLGIELSHKYARFAAFRFAKHGIENVRMVDADAQRVFREVLPAGCAQAVHVYFPDPWWKARHKKRRIINPAFVQQIERVLSPGGRLHFWTDVQEYYQTSLQVLAEHTSLAGPLAIADDSPEAASYRTHFDRRKRMAGKTIHRAQFRKNADGQTDPQQREES